MKRNILEYICAMLLFLVMPVAAQDSVKTIILSPRVGTEIDSDERKQFGLFRHFQEFVRAVFYALNHDTYYCVVTYRSGGSEKDSVISYGTRALHALAEKINHYEALVAGTYTMGQDPATIQVYGGGSIPYAGQLKPTDRSRSGFDDLLPYARSRISETPFRSLVEFPIMSLGLSFSTYYPDLSGINDAFNTIENRYRTSQYQISHVNPDLNTSSLFWLSLVVHLSNASSILLETVNQKNFKVLSAGYLYRFATFDEIFSGLVGGGIGRYYFFGTVLYHQPINNAYYYLDEIRYSGGAIGFTIQLGFEVGHVDNVRVSVFIKNISIPPVETTLQEGVTATVRLGGTIIVGKIELPL